MFFVCVGDFSRYTWVGFICEKLDTFIIFEILCHHLQPEKGEEIGNIFPNS